MNNIMEHVPELWRERINSDSQLFKESDLAVSILVNGYGRALQIHDKMVSIANNESKSINGEWNGNQYAKEIYFINKDRSRIEREFRRGSRKLFSFFSEFSEIDQLECLNLVFDEMPITRATSLKELKGSLFGMLQFPRRYIKGVEMACSYTSKEFPNHGILWSPKEFERTFDSYIEQETNHSRSNDENTRKLKRITYAGSYEGGKRR